MTQIKLNFQEAKAFILLGKRVQRELNQKGRDRLNGFLDSLIVSARDRGIQIKEMREVGFEYRMNCVPDELITYLADGNAFLQIRSRNLEVVPVSVKYNLIPEDFSFYTYDFQG